MAPPAPPARERLQLRDDRLAMLSAALRHVRDAAHLLRVEGSARSPDQAWHLAGYGPECARKASLARSEFDKALGHRVEGPLLAALSLARDLDPLAHRYDMDAAFAAAPLAGWHEASRYEGTGAHDDEGDAARLVEQSEAVVHTIAFRLWADGRVPVGARW